MPPEGNQCDGSHSAQSRVIGEKKNEKNFATLRVKTWSRVTQMNTISHSRLGIERATNLVEVQRKLICTNDAHINTLRVAWAALGEMSRRELRSQSFIPLDGALAHSSVRRTLDTALQTRHGALDTALQIRHGALETARVREETSVAESSLETALDGAGCRPTAPST